MSVLVLDRIKLHPYFSVADGTLNPVDPTKFTTPWAVLDNLESRLIDRNNKAIDMQMLRNATIGRVIGISPEQAHDNAVFSINQHLKITQQNELQLSDVIIYYVPIESGGHEIIVIFIDNSSTPSKPYQISNYMTGPMNNLPGKRYNVILGLLLHFVEMGGLVEKKKSPSIKDTKKVTGSKKKANRNVAR